MTCPTTDDLHVLQGDDDAKHFTVSYLKSQQPFDLSDEWTAVFEVAPNSQAGATFVYSTEDASPKIAIDSQIIHPGGISLRFLSSDISVPTPANAPLWYRLKIFHPTDAPLGGRTVRHGYFFVDDA